MHALNRYLGIEILAVHLLTGMLFAVINALMFAVVWSRNPLFALALTPVALFSWWGWYAEDRVMARVASGGPE